MGTKNKQSWEEVIQDYKQAKEQLEYFKTAYLIRLASLRQANTLLRRARVHVNAQEDVILEQDMNEFLRINGHLEHPDA